MAFTSADLDAIDRAIASGVLKVRFADGRQVDYRGTDDLLRARALIAGTVTPASADPTTTPGGVTYAEWSRD
jgi:hypothetical protein